MLDKKFILAVVIILLLVTVENVKALRVARPAKLKYPLTEEQITDLNNTLEQLFDMQGGRYEADIETSTKSNANEGEIWLIKTGSTVYIQYKGNNRVYTLTPQGF